MKSLFRKTLPQLFMYDYNKNTGLNPFFLTPIKKNKKIDF